MSSSPSPLFLTFSALLVFHPLIVTARQCTEGFVTEARKYNVSQHCYAKSLNAEFAWNFDNNTKRLDVAFGARLDADTAWLAWGLNPQGPHMVGTRALIGIKHHNGTRECGKYNITDATKRRCQQLPTQDIGLDVHNFTFLHHPEIGYDVIHATIVLSDQDNASRMHIVWQVGEAAVGNEPLMHPKTLDHLDSAETVDLLSAQITGFKPYLRHRLRTVHGVLNIIGWGILLPAGVIIARYFKVFPIESGEKWVIFHVVCQIAGYGLGCIGWTIGLCLGGFSKYYTFLTHRILGILIFTFTTIQMMALRLKPKGDDEYRTYWNMYHHSLGYALLVLIAMNIFQGIKIMEPNHAWKWAYVGVLGVLGCVTLALEIHTWIKFRIRPKPR